MGGVGWFEKKRCVFLLCCFFSKLVVFEGCILRWTYFIEVTPPKMLDRSFENGRWE